jgi:hypothetical protein
LAGRHLQQIQQGNRHSRRSGTLSVTDADGVVLGRLPKHLEFVGRQIPAAAMAMVRAPRSGIMYVPSVDGVVRVFGYIPPSPATNNLMTAVGFKEADLMADINSALWQGAMLLVLVTIAVATLTWIAARRFIGRPTESLVAVARRWRRGFGRGRRIMMGPSSARLAPPGTKWREHCRCDRSNFRSTPNHSKRVWPSGRGSC